MKHLTILSILCAVLCWACAGEDRSGEQPFAPTVKTYSFSLDSDSATLVGIITASPNSPVTKRGFLYGLEATDSTKATSVTLASADTTDAFRASTPILSAGRYYALAFATNGIGTSYGDTLRFVIP